MNLIKINDVANKNSVFNYILNSLINKNLTAIKIIEKLNMLSQHTMAWYLVSLIICRGSGSATEYPMMVGPNTLARLVRGILQSGMSPTLYKNRPVKNLYQISPTLYKNRPVKEFISETPNTVQNSKTWMGFWNLLPD